MFFLRSLTLVVCLLTGWDFNFAAEPTFRVGGYLPDYRVGLVSPEVGRQLDELILFSIELKSDGTLDESRFTEKHWQGTAALRQTPGLRTLICVGGWDRSDGFAAICQSPALRQKAGQALIRYCLKYQLAGVNLDWEHPSTADEQQAFATLLVELKQEFAPHKLELSIAVAASQKLPPTGWAAADRVMLMSYDDGGKHSSFEASQKHLAMMIEQGVKPSQIVLCVPFYGRHEVTRDPLTYADIMSKFSPRADQDEVNGTHYNGPGTIAAKTQWAKTLGLAGVAVWELGQDAPGEASLLKIIRQVARP
jgi:chitinase